MAELHVMMGISGSGKSTKAKYLVDSRGQEHVCISSDGYREKLLGDVNDQSKNTEIFEEMFKDMKLLLDSGQSVVFDATNLNRKRRIALLKRFPHVKKIGHVQLCPLDVALTSDAMRDRHVPIKTIKRQYTQFEVPVYQEGWNSIIPNRRRKFVHPHDYGKYLENEMENGTYEDIFGENSDFSWLFSDIRDLPQDNLHHSFSVSRHTYHVLKGVNDEFTSYDRLLLQYVALFHDFGKPFTKSFVNFKGEKTRYASFIGHENVSWQLAVQFLLSFGYDEGFAYAVAMAVGLHMKVLQLKDSPTGLKKFKDFIGQANFETLERFSKIDESAK